MSEWKELAGLKVYLEHRRYLIEQGYKLCVGCGRLIDPLCDTEICTDCSNKEEV